MKIDKEIYERVVKETRTDYGAQYTKDPDDDFVWVLDEHSVESMLDELLYLIDTQRTEYDDLKQDMVDNYKYIGGNYDI